MAKNEFGPGKEFFTEWHRDAYIEACERDVQACQARLEELEAIDADSATEATRQAKERLDNAKRELRRVAGHGQKTAAKRPAGQDKETR